MKGSRNIAWWCARHGLASNLVNFLLFFGFLFRCYEKKKAWFNLTGIIISKGMIRKEDSLLLPAFIRFMEEKKRIQNKGDREREKKATRDSLTVVVYPVEQRTM